MLRRRRDVVLWITYIRVAVNALGRGGLAGCWLTVHRGWRNARFFHRLAVELKEIGVGLEMLALAERKQPVD
jgi:hypothetical protein